MTTTYVVWIVAVGPGTANATCNGAMRERYPRSGFGLTFMLAVIAAAVFFAFKNLLTKIPRP